MNKTFLNTPAKEYTLQKVSKGSAPKAALILIVSHLLSLTALLVLWLMIQGDIFSVEEENEFVRFLLAGVNLFLYILLVSASLSYLGFDGKNRSFTDSQLKALKKLRIVLQLGLITVGLCFILTVAN